MTLASVGQKEANIVTMSRGVKIQADLAIEACVDLAFDLIVVPGVRCRCCCPGVATLSASLTYLTFLCSHAQGLPGANYLRDSTVLTELLKQQKHQGKLYGAICAAPAVVLHTHGLLASPATGYPGFEKQVTSAEHSTERVVVSGTCITSQGPGTAMEMGVKLVELLCGKDKAAQVAKGLLLRA